MIDEEMNVTGLSRIQAIRQRSFSFFCFLILSHRPVVHIIFKLFADAECRKTILSNSGTEHKYKFHKIDGQ